MARCSLSGVYIQCFFLCRGVVMRFSKAVLSVLCEVHHTAHNRHLQLLLWSFWNVVSRHYDSTPVLMKVVHLCSACCGCGAVDANISYRWTSSNPYAISIIISTNIIWIIQRMYSSLIYSLAVVSISGFLSLTPIFSIACRQESHYSPWARMWGTLLYIDKTAGAPSR